MEQQQRVNPVTAVIGIIVAVGMAWFYFGGGLERQAARDLNRIQTQVANDFVQQYEVAKRNGTAMDRCVRAGLVAEGFLQAKNEASYAHWKAIEKADCAAAGVSK
jgi:hypothetical protein